MLTNTVSRYYFYIISIILCCMHESCYWSQTDTLQKLPVTVPFTEWGRSYFPALSLVSHSLTSIHKFRAAFFYLHVNLSHRSAHLTNSPDPNSVMKLAFINNLKPANIGYFPIWPYHFSSLIMRSPSGLYNNWYFFVMTTVYNFARTFLSIVCCSYLGLYTVTLCVQYGWYMWHLRRLSKHQIMTAWWKAYVL